MTPTPEYLRPATAAAEFSVSRATIYRWRARGLLTFRKQGTMTFIRRADLVALIEQNTERD